MVEAVSTHVGGSGSILSAGRGKMVVGPANPTSTLHWRASYRSPKSTGQVPSIGELATDHKIVPDKYPPLES